MDLIFGKRFMASIRRSLAILAAAVLALSACNKSATVGAASAEDMSLGSPNAKVTVAEYASASCPHCARFNNEVFPEFKKKYVDTGKVRYVFHEFLTPPVQFAAAGFLTARCAGPDKYFSVLDAIYRDQENIYKSNDLRGGLLRIAQSAGMTEKQFTDCISDEKALNALNARVEKVSTQDNINATPTFIVNGTKLEGEQTLAQLDAAIAAASK
jgi:protein-disulfide isomerase